MASFRKLKNGTYQATISAGRDANGKQIRMYVTKPTLKECKSAAREIEQEIEEGKYSNMSKMRFNAWCEKWLELNIKRLSPSTYITYKIYIEHHFYPYFQKYKLGQITDIHIKEYIANKTKEGLSTTTIRKHFLVLRRILGEALKAKNPAIGIEVPKKAYYEHHIVTDEELNKILDFFKGTKEEIIILLSAWCGFRRGEIFALKWNDIDWEKCMIRIDESRALSEEGYIDKEPKTHNGFRTVTVPKQLMTLLEVYRKKQKSINERIFTIRPDHFSSRFAKIIKDPTNNLPQIRFHDLRHYHASWLYKQGVPDQYAAYRLGHDINTLKTIYQHLDEKIKHDIDSKITDKLTAQNTAQNS